MLKRINIEDAENGMVLGKDVEDKIGRPILKAGDVIKASFVPRLKQWGVDSILVDVPSEEGEPEINPDEITELLDAKFKNFDASSHMMELKAAAHKSLITGRVKF